MNSSTSALSNFNSAITGRWFFTIKKDCRGWSYSVESRRISELDKRINDRFRFLLVLRSRGTRERNQSLYRRKSQPRVEREGPGLPPRLRYFVVIGLLQSPRWRSFTSIISCKQIRLVFAFPSYCGLSQFSLFASSTSSSGRLILAPLCTRLYNGAVKIFLVGKIGKYRLMHD